MSETQERTTLQDFGNGILAGLVENGHLLLDEERRDKLHEAFLEAFIVVEEEVGLESLDFYLKTDEPRDLPANVHGIIYGWRHGLLALREQPSESLHMLYVDDKQSSQLMARIPGGIELYKRAAARLIEHLNTPYIPIKPPQ